MTVWTPTDDGFADLSSHDTFVNGAPHNTFARLRREDPLSWTDWDGGKGFWNVVRHADITELAIRMERSSLSRSKSSRRPFDFITTRSRNCTRS